MPKDDTGAVEAALGDPGARQAPTPEAQGSEETSCIGAAPGQSQERRFAFEDGLLMSCDNHVGPPSRKSDVNDRKD